jgi:hypothetical protein
MAEPWVDRSITDAEAAVRPFDRQALQATLADVMRNADTSGLDPAAAPRVVTGPPDASPTSPAWAPPPASAMQGAPTAPPGLHLTPPATPAPAPMGVGRPGPVPSPQPGAVRAEAPTATGPAPAGPAPAPAGPPRSAPSPLDLNSVLSRPAAPARTSNPFGPGKLPSDGAGAGSGELGARRPTPSILGGGSSGALGSPSILGGALGISTDLNPRPSETPVDKPTIPLRRPRQDECPSAAAVEPAPALTGTQPAPPSDAAYSMGASAPDSSGYGATGPAGGYDGMPGVPAWSPLDDDIMPRTAGKQSFRLRR